MGSSTKTFALALAAFTYVALGTTPAGAAVTVVPAPDAATAEARFVSLVNEARAARGLPALVRDERLVSIARAHSARMADAGRIFHSTNLATLAPSAWRLLGENVGVGVDAGVLHEAFMASPTHRDNIEGAFSHVGIGVVYGSGAMYVTVVFMAAAPAKPAAQAAAHTAPQTDAGPPRGGNAQPDLAPAAAAPEPVPAPDPSAQRPRLIRF